MKFENVHLRNSINTLILSIEMITQHRYYIGMHVSFNGLVVNTIWEYV